MKKLAAGLIAVAIAVSASTMPAHAVQAPPGVAVDMYYYADVGETQLVGHYREYCDGSMNGWGSISEYSRWYYYGC
jgi:hypothetical protein